MYFAAPAIAGLLASVVTAAPHDLKNKDCTLSEVGNDYFLRGPVDVYDFKAVTNKTCGSYLCGSVKEMAHIIDDDASASASTYPVGGYWGIVGRD